MRWPYPVFALLVAVVSGCSSVRVRVDTRVAEDGDLRARLNGPAYVIRGPNEEAESSLAFQEFAETLAHALEMHCPDLHRVGLGDPADFAILMHITVADLGAGVTSYPVYGSQYGRGYGPCGPVYYHGYGVVGTEVRTIHYGYDHVLQATAYIQDAAAPAGRRVLWEGMAGLIEDANDIGEAMPYLALGLSSVFGEATDGTRTIKFSHRDDEVRYLRRWVHTGERPATRPESTDE